MGITVNNNAGSTIGEQIIIDNHGQVYIGGSPRAPASRDELRGLIDALWLQVGEAQRRGELPAGLAEQAMAKIAAAASEAKKEQPARASVRENLEGAKILIEGLAGAAGLVPAFISAAETVQKLLP